MESMRMIEIWACPFGERCYQRGSAPVWNRVWKRPQGGWTGPWGHLVKCANGGATVNDPTNLMKVYNDSKQAAQHQGVKTRPGTLTGYMKSVSKVTEHASDVCDWLKMIVNKHLPLTAVDDKEHRDHAKYKSKVSYKKMVKVMHKVVEIVEKSITHDLHAAKKAGGKGSILYDGWTSSSNEHFVGLFASFSKPSKGMLNGTEHYYYETRSALLACSPMDHHGHPAEEDRDHDQQIEAAARFNAEQHVEFFEETMRYYNLSIGESITNESHDEYDIFVCQTTDNALVCKKIARLLKIKSVGCHNHKLNLEMERFVVGYCEELMEKCRKTMVTIRNSTIFSALLRNKTTRQSIFYNDTRWYGKYFMLKCWLELREHVLAVNAELLAERATRRTIEIDSSPAFEGQVKQFALFFECFHKTHCEMEHHDQSLESCRAQLDALVEKLDIVEQLHESDKLANCPMDPKYIRTGSDIVKYPEFERGVVKIQRGEAGNMTAPEQRAVQSLLRNNMVGADGESDDAKKEDPRIHSPTRLASMRASKQKLDVSRRSNEDYIDCDFIFGSVALVERLWSVAKHVLRDDRKNMKPVNVEALLFLNYNSTSEAVILYCSTGKGRN